MEIATAQNHVDTVLRTVHSRSAPAASLIAASWSRSAMFHGLDPAASKSRDCLESHALGHRQAALAKLLRLAASKLDHLYGLLGSAGCTVILTDADGIVLDRRCSVADTADFDRWGLREGADWSEAAEGTNGIGTCLAEQRQVIVHGPEHFLARNVAMSCVDAPIHGAEGQLIGALDVSSARANQTDMLNRLIASSVVQMAQRIEAETFRATFPGARILCADQAPSDAVALLAVNSDDIVIGATRGARKAFHLPASGPFSHVPATDLFGREDGATGFAKAERAAIQRALTRAQGNASKAARDLGIGRATLYRRMKRLQIET
ncbi:helix-turn-helix domain-containing protein [Roseibium sediminis]|uniref:helix-turn-helix domain-containing protein n=1 Tax=Roseibium sediminis TaxID=1775174 RepID=UPI001AD92328|nr:GAF domain-containing protein [Roseibium sediminis]